MLILGLEPTWSVSEAYWYCATTGSPTTKYSKDLHCLQLRPLQQRLHTRLGKLMNVNSSFNFKLSKRTGVSG